MLLISPRQPHSASDLAFHFHQEIKRKPVERSGNLPNCTYLSSEHWISIVKSMRFELQGGQR
jgi:hypothetical protein